MTDIMTRPNWNAFRILVCVAMSELSGKPIIPIYYAPKGAHELYKMGVNILRDMDLANTIQKTKEALEHAADTLAFGHEVAAAVAVGAPSQENVASLENALLKVSAHVAQGQRSKAAFKIILAVANALDDELEEV